MKRLIKIIIILLVLQGCDVQKNIKMIKPEINNTFEKFEISKLSNKREINKTKGEDIYITKTDYSYEIRDIEGKNLLYYSKGMEKGSAFSGYDYTLNPLVGVYKEFYPSNNIKTKGVYCWFGFKIGKWYNYSDGGNLISVENFDNGFFYDMDDIFSFCKKNGISLEKKDSGYRTTISKYKSPLDNKNYWFIQYPSYEKQVYINIQIDGVSGNIVNIKEIPFPTDE